MIKQLPDPSWIESTLRAINAYPFAALCIVMSFSLITMGLLLIYLIRARK